MSRRKLLLIDGMSNVFRAFYGIRRLSRQGLPTNAIFGFTTMLRKVLNDEQPDYIAVVFDSAEPTFRHQMYAEYKANRAAMPDELATQMPYIFRVCEALRIPIIQQPGYEADDLIGTMARQAVDQGLDVVIVSNDKDLCQLVNDHVIVIKADQQTRIVLDARGVEQRLGVPPSQVVDVLALWGDSSDNIPGAPGIGEKGSVQIIKQFGSLEKALAGWEQVERKSYRESLRDHRDLILTSRELVRIKTDVPLEIDWTALERRPPDQAKAYALFTELDFTSLLKDFTDERIVSAAAPTKAGSAATPEVPVRYHTVTAQPEVQQAFESLWSRDRFAFVLDTTREKLQGIALSSQPYAADYIDLRTGQYALDGLRAVMENGLLAKTTYDLKPAIKLLRSQGITVEGACDDVMIAAWLLEPNRGKYELAALAHDYLHLDVSGDAGFDACRQADAILRLTTELHARLQQQQLESVYHEIELPLIVILAEMELAGVSIDLNLLREVSVELESKLAGLSEKIYEQAGRTFNINSPQQLADVLEALNIQIKRKTKKTGRVSTSADVLAEVAAEHPIVQHILDYRELAKLKGTYVDALPKLIDPRTGRIHTTFDQTGTATGRLSSRNPNLQNIPVRSAMGREIRKAFVAAPGHQLVVADYSQIDLRVLAHMSGDEAMTRAFRQGRDIHAEVARTVFGATTEAEERELRRLAKIVNFAIAYGIGAFGLAQRVGLSRTQAKQVIENYYRTYPGVRRYMHETIESARRQGFVRSLCGRIRQIPQITDRNANVRQRAEREAINAPIQGGSADIFKLGMIRVHRALQRQQLKARMVLHVHDEVLLEVPEPELLSVLQLVKQEMEQAYPLSVPLVVDVAHGRNWLEVK